MSGTINELKLALLKCANENENKTYLTGQVIISSICKDANDTLERLEKENEQLKAQIDKLKEEKQYETCPYRSTDMGCDYCDYRNRDLKDEVEE